MNMRKHDNFCKALDNLHEGLGTPEPYSIVVQTGIAGLFEICFEQSWKLMKELLEIHGIMENRIGSPRAVIKTAYQCKMISDEAGWLNILDTRNTLAHHYSEADAAEAIKLLKEKFVYLFDDLKKNIDENWLDL